MKRKFFVAFILALFLEILFCGVSLATHYGGTCGDNLTWSYDTHTDTMFISGTGEMYNFYSISDIPWYSIRSEFSKISVENGVTRIGYNAFLDCMDVTAIDISSSVTDIDSMAFRGCFSLKSIKIPSHTASIGDYAFRGCSSLTEIIFPESVSSIGPYSFYDCTSLTSVTILNPNAVIGNATYNDFRDCPSNLTLHGYANSTTEAYAAAAGLHFEALALSGTCGTNLTYNLDPYKGTLSITGSGSMTNYFSDQDVPWFDFREKITSLSIKGVTSIGDNAFNSFTGLTRVVIPDGVKSIGSFAFYNCSGLTSIILPSSVTFIDMYAFQYCNSLDVVYYGDTFDRWQEIDTGDGNIDLTGAAIVFDVPAPTFRLPEGLTTIEADAFTGINAKAVWIPSSVKNIDGNPFEGSDVEYIYGDPKTSIAQTFAWQYDYDFVPYSD